MLLSYFIIAWRNLKNHKGYSLINIGGLAVGMAVAMLIGFWIYDELTYNKYHKNHDRIAQVMQHQTFNGHKGTESSIPIPLVTELKNKYGDDFKYLAMASWQGDHILTFGEKQLTREGNYMDADITRMLGLEMIEGDHDGLKEPHSILLSESTAKALFGDAEPIGQAIKIDNKLNVSVTGIYKDLPYKTELRELKFIAPWDLYVSSMEWVRNARDENQWGNNSFQLFAQIADHADMATVSEKIKLAKQDQVDEEEKKFKAEIFLHPMADWHLRSNWVEGVKTGGFIQYVWLFAAVGLFVLLLACINFMNLSTARCEKRAREVGIRKSLGSQRGQLIRQFFSESLLVVLFAFLTAVGIILIALPWFNAITKKQMAFPGTSLSFWLIGGIFIAITGILAGSYPALYLSSFQPVKVLKGTFRVGRLASLPRKILVVLQFTVSVTMIIGTVLIYQQVLHTKNRPLGYDNRGMIMTQMKSPDFYGKLELLRNELINNGAILEMSESSSPLTGIWSNNGGFNWKGKDPNLQAEFATVWVSHEFGNSVGWKFKQGRDFSRSFSTDSSALVINEAAVRFMNIEQPVGKVVRWGDELHGKDYTIVGVIEDMLMQSPYEPVKQTVFLLGEERANWMNFKLNPEKGVQESIGQIEAAFKKFIPSAPFDYSFVDEEFSKKFDAEERVGKLAAVFAILAVFISCLGLFGLASFTAEQRTKEIGVRKVLGASVTDLWAMLSRDFTHLVLLSCLISIPLSYWLLKDWLENYQYRTQFSWWIFVFAGLSALLIALITVSFQAIKAALANPIRSLRTE